MFLELDMHMVSALGTRHDVKQFIFNRLGTYHGTELPTGPGTMEFVGCGLFGILRSSGIRFRHFWVTVGVGARLLAAR